MPRSGNACWVESGVIWRRLAGNQKTRASSKTRPRHIANGSHGCGGSVARSVASPEQTKKWHVDSHNDLLGIGYEFG
eukprot:4515277-Lingulodinium_polyedra.AAC.1